MQDAGDSGAEQRRTCATQALEAAASSLATAADMDSRHTEPGGEARVKELVLATLASVDVFDREEEHNAASHEERGCALSLRGQALALLSRVAEAEETLTRAVKLCPALTDAWNSLGELAWKRGDLQRAHAAFSTANAKHSNVQSLRNLSGVSRSMAQGARTPAAQQALVSDSVAFAKAAVALDVDDGASWSQLAMALMALAFACGRTRAADLGPAAKAFAHSAKKGTAQHSADMCFNRGVLLRFLDDVQGALDCFSAAGALDPALPWRARVDDLARDVARVNELVRTRGHLKPKRVQEAAAALLAMRAPAGCVAVATQALADGANAGQCTLGSVLAVASAPGAVPLVAVAVDALGDCFAMSVFGVQEGALREGTTCAVLSPLVTRVQATLPPEGLQAAYTLLRVEGAAALQCWLHGAWAVPQAQRETPSVRFQV